MSGQALTYIERKIMDRQVIERYAAGADLPGKEIAGLTKEQLNAHPVPGTWSIQQIVMHLMDSDLIGADRMKRIIAEEQPPAIIGYDETAFSKNLFYDQLDAAAACQIFAANRRLMAEILRRLPDEAFERSGMHNERGKVTLGEQLALYAWHAEHHLKFLREKKAMVGK
jgi:uncharacterized damage-inducible protein DinB